MFEGGSEKPELCPGETDCERFQSSSGKTYALKVRNACSGCHLLPTKTDKGKKHHKSLERIVNEAWRVRLQRISGFPADRNRVRWIATETLLMIEQLIENEIVNRRERQTQVLMKAFNISMR